MTPLEQKYPQVKVNYAQISKTLNLDKDLVYHILADLFGEIQNLLVSGQELEVNLSTFGK
jgi:nucleoid DNA-binding protein